MFNKCNDDYNNLIIKNKKIFKKIHNRKSIPSQYLANYDFSNDENIIIIPVTINICLTKEKYKIDFVKYSKYIIDTLNDGFSGNISCKYKNDKNNKYNKDFFKNKLIEKYDKEAENYANIIYNYINKKVDTKIRFYLDSIEYYNTNFEIEFKNSDIEKLINYFFRCGFKIRKENKYNLNINIIKFLCKTLGVSTFPWMKYLLNIPSTMMIFIDYQTIHPDISNNSFNECKTLIHETGHIFGLKHIFYNDKESLDVYKILLGKIIYEKEFLNNINKESNNILHLSDIKRILFKITGNRSNNLQLYNDIPYQKKPTINNPIETNEYQIINNNLCNFCCFMDYSPDAVLTHFTESQKRIMYYFIIIFKSYLINNSKKLESKLLNTKIKYYVNENIKIDIDDKNNSVNINKINTTTEFIIEYDIQNNFEYKIYGNV
jgi:hypothetical protein